MKLEMYQTGYDRYTFRNINLSIKVKDAFTKKLGTTLEPNYMVSTYRVGQEIDKPGGHP